MGANDKPKINCAGCGLQLLARVAGQARRQSAAAPPSHSLLGLGVAGSRNEPHSGCPVVELDEDQKAALLALGPQLAAVMKAQREEGFREGDSLLRRLALGQVKPGNFEQWSAEGRGQNGDKR
jgi:hypothetical protein